MAEKINVPIVTSYDDKAAKKALTDAEKIDKLKPELEIGADADDANKAIKEVTTDAKALEKLDPEVTITTNDQATGDLKTITDQAEALSRADAEIIVRAKIDAAKGDLKALQQQLQDLEDHPVDVKVDTTSARTGIDDLGKSAGSSKSVLANMVGNTTQDLGALGGIAGSTGVAIGQMGEYMADARAEGEGFSSILKNFAGVAGPIAAVSVGLAAVNSIMSDMAKGQAATKAFDKKQIEQFTDAIEDGTHATEAYADTLEDTGEVLADVGLKGGPAWAKIIPPLGKLTEALGLMGRFGDKIEDILPILTQAGISSDVWTQIVTAGVDQQVTKMDALRTALDQTNLSDDDRSKILIAARAAQDNYTEAVDNAAIVNGFFKTSQDASNAAMEEYVGWLEQQGEKNKEAAAAAHEEAVERQRAADASDNHRDAIARVNQERERVDARAELRKERDAVDDVTEAYDRMHSEISDRKSLLQLQGDFDTLRTKAEEAWTASAEGAEDAEQKQRDYQIAQIDTIDNALEYIKTVEGIPKKAVTDIEALIDQGKYNEALGALETLSRPRSVALQASLDTSRLEAQYVAWLAAHNINPRFAPRAAGGVTGNEMTLLGEDGPELVKLPSGSTVIPANVSSAMMHNGVGGSGTFTVNVNMPKGSRGVDVVKQISGQARRSGRRYGTPVVHYARR